MSLFGVEKGLTQENIKGTAVIPPSFMKGYGFLLLRPKKIHSTRKKCMLKLFGQIEKKQDWTNRKETGQVGDYEIKDGTLIRYSRFYPPHLKNTIVYKLLDNKIQRLGNLQVGKKIAAKGTLLDPARPGNKDEVYIKKLDNPQSWESNFIKQSENPSDVYYLKISGESEIKWDINQWRKVTGKKLKLEDDIGDGDKIICELIRPVTYKDSIMLIVKTETGKELVFETRFQDEWYYHILEIDGIKLDGYLSLSDSLGNEWLNKVKSGN